MEIKNIRKSKWNLYLFFLLIESKVICISFKTNNISRFYEIYILEATEKAVVALRCAPYPSRNFPLKM